MILLQIKQEFGVKSKREREREREREKSGTT
jgi:hypothetical protein